MQRILFQTTIPSENGNLNRRHFCAFLIILLDSSHCSLLSVTDKFWELTSNKPISKLDLAFLTIKCNLRLVPAFGPSGTSKSIFKWTDNLGTNGFTEAKPRGWCLTPEDMGDVQFSCKTAFLMHVQNPHHGFHDFLRVKGEWG